MQKEGNISQADLWVTARIPQNIKVDMRFVTWGWVSFLCSRTRKTVKTISINETKAADQGEETPLMELRNQHISMTITNGLWILLLVSQISVDGIDIPLPTE